MLNYSAVNNDVFFKIPKSSNRILDVGCGTGELGKYIKKEINQAIHITGVTYSNAEAEIARNNIDEVVVHDLNKASEIEGIYDCIICSHVLEHLYDPKCLLNSLQKNLDTSGLIIIALPNILFFKQRWRFLLGEFKYSYHGGLMDVTHYRFFDWNSARSLVEEAGYHIKSRKAHGYFPLPLIRKIKPVSKRIDMLATSLFPGLFGFQFVIVASKNKI